MATSFFKDKRVIVTGCSSGIGLATTQRFLSEGSLVFGIDLNAIPEVLSAHPQNSSFTFHKTNLAKLEEIESARAAFTSHFNGPVDVLVNAAGIADGFSSADTANDAEFARVIAVNLTAPVMLMRAVLPGMKEARSGAIVNVSSIAGERAGTAGIAYTSSKHGLNGATKHVAWRFKNDGIRCNAVAPGGVATNIQDSIDKSRWDPEGYESVKPMINLHVASRSPSGFPTAHIVPDDIADGILFLASDKAKAISGSVMPIDTAWSTI